MVDTVIIGAGLAGLVAARELARAGQSVIVVDKGGGIGGRLATRRLGDARIDHGAQFFTVRHPRFADLAQEWSASGAARDWCHGFAQQDGHPRYVGAKGMTTLAKHLAAGLDVRSSTTVEALQPDGVGWRVKTTGGTTMPPCRAVICTTPVPQSLALLRAGDVHLSEPDSDALDRVAYSPVLAAMVVLDSPSRVPPPGGVQAADGPFTWIGDNQAKGVSAVPALTLHTTPDVARARWDDPAEEVLADLLVEAGQWTGAARVLDAQLHRWRFAQPTVLHPDRCLLLDGHAPLVCAGDAFGEARVEGAALSGWAAADTIMSALG